MDLRKLSNDHFVRAFEERAATERKVMSEVIEFVREGLRREIWFEVKLTSMWDFMTKHLKYSSGAAQRRIDAAKLYGEVAELKTWVENGDINLTQVTNLAYAIKAKQKASDALVSVEQKKEIFESIRNTVGVKSDQVIAKMLDISIEDPDQVQIQQDGGQLITFRLTPEQVALMNSVRSEMSHVNPNPKTPEILEYSFRKTLSAKLKNSKVTSVMEVDANDGKLVSFSKRRRSRNPAYIPAQLRRVIEREQPCCRWKNQDGSACGSQFQLEIDHIKSLWAGGETVRENLQRLCGIHNRLKYRREANIKRC